MINDYSACVAPL